MIEREVQSGKKKKEPNTLWYFLTSSVCLCPRDAVVCSWNLKRPQYETGW